MDYIKRMKEELRLFNAAAKDLAKMRRENEERLHPNVARGENQRLQTVLDQIRDETRAKIEGIYKEATASVEAWGKLDGSKIDADDTAILNGGFPLTAQQLRAMARKHEGNYTMLAKIQQYATDHKLISELGYVPTAADKRRVYEDFQTSALRLLGAVYENPGEQDASVAAFGDPNSRVISDPAYICVMRGGLAALDAAEAGETPAGEAVPAAFDFHFKPLLGRDSA